MATLSSLWQTPPETAPGSDPRLRAVLQIGAIVGLLLVIIVGVNITPLWLGNVR